MAQGIYKSSIYTYGGNLQEHRVVVWHAVSILHTAVWQCKLSGSWVFRASQNLNNHMVQSDGVWGQLIPKKNKGNLLLIANLIVIWNLQWWSIWQGCHCTTNCKQGLVATLCLQCHKSQGGSHTWADGTKDKGMLLSSLKPDKHFQLLRS